MIATWKQYEGQAVDGIPLLRLLGESDSSAVYLAELAGERCAIKLVLADEAEAQLRLARWQQASKLSHPHLTRIHQWGRARLDGKSLVYLAMEYAEETLSNVDRPLTAKEGREMLTPAVAALTYIHSKGMAHGRLKPSNILSANDVLKISGDTPLRFGEGRGGNGKSTVYDAPELGGSGASAATDAWSLGITMVEALTKELPAVEADPARLPDSLKPESFREVATGCLVRDAALRWTVADVQQWLERGTVPAPKQAKRKYVWPAAAVATLAIAGVIAWPYLKSSSADPVASATPSTTTATPSTPATPSKPPQTVAPSSPAPSPNTAKTKQPAPQPSPVAVEAAPPALLPSLADPPKETSPKETAPKEVPAKEAPSKEVAAKEAVPKDQAPAPGDVIPADVVQPVRPNVSAKDRATVRGKVPISVRVEADPTGAVTEAKVESGGSSAFFADLALKASRQWKFASAESGSVWLLRFEFTKNPQVSTQATRIR